jgi:hypothetical protein
VTAALMRRLPSGSGGSAIATCCLTPPAPRSSAVGTASARLGLHRRDIRHQPTLRAAVSAQFQLSRPADSQVIAPRHRLHPNLVPSQGRTPGCASRRRTRPGPTRSQFGPLRTSVMSNSDYRNHPALARKLQAYLRWRNAQGSLPRHAGRPAPRARPHPQRTPATLGPPQTQGCLTNPVNVRGQRTSNIDDDRIRLRTEQENPCPRLPPGSGIRRLRATCAWVSRLRSQAGRDMG